VEALRTVKDAIGEWHDWVELLGIAKEVLDDGRTCKLIRQIKDTSEQKYESAIAEAQNVRKKFWRVRSSKADGGLSHAAKPVWKAMTAIAT